MQRNRPLKKYCTKSSLSSPSQPIKEKSAPHKENMYQLPSNESDENYHLSKSEQKEIGKMANQKNDNNTEVVDLELEQNHSGEPPQTRKTSTSKPKEPEDPPRNPFYHQRARGIRKLQEEIRRQRQRIFSIKDECHLINMKQDLLMSEISFCSTVEDIDDLKNKYSLKG